MTILADHQIRQLAQRGMIEPWFEGYHRPGEISYGISSYGYDAVLAPKIKLFSNLHGYDHRSQGDGRALLLATSRAIASSFPNSYALSGIRSSGSRIPRDVVVICLGKSTYARPGSS